MTHEQNGQNAGGDDPEPKEFRAALIDAFDALKHTLKGRRREKKKPPTEHQINERMMARWTGRVGVFTFFLLLSTIASDWIFYGQLKVMRGQLAEMKGTGAQTDRAIELQSQANGANGFQGARIDQLAKDTQRLADYSRRIGDIGDKQRAALQTTAEAAKGSAEAAHGQVAIMQADQRPWIAVEISPNGPFDFSRGGWATQNFKIVFRNVGRSPAFNVQGAIFGFAFTEKNEDLDAATNRSCDYVRAATRAARSDLGAVVFPGGAVDNPPQISAIAFPPSEIAGKAQILPFVYGCVDYTFGSPRTHHQTGFIYRLVHRVRMPNYLIGEAPFDVGQIVPAEDIVLIPTTNGSWRID